MAPSPAPAAEATSSGAQVRSIPSRAAILTATAPAARRGAPSRPTELPDPTVSTWRAASAKGRSTPIARARPPEASATTASTPTTPPVARSHHHRAPATSPPSAGAATRRQAGAAATRSGREPRPTP